MSGSMEPGFHSLLYREPRLYDLLFPDADDSIGRMCQSTFRRYLPVPPSTGLGGAISAPPDVAGMRARKLYVFARTR